MTSITNVPFRFTSAPKTSVLHKFNLASFQQHPHNVSWHMTIMIAVSRNQFWVFLNESISKLDNTQMYLVRKALGWLLHDVHHVFVKNMVISHFRHYQAIML